MSHKQSRFFKECLPRAFPLEDILLGLQTAQLSKDLPTNLKILICNMSIGYWVYCIGASEAKLDKNGIKNVRDIKCLIQKFSSVPPQKVWTCWPCKDYLKKFNPKVWKQRTRLACLCNLDTESQRFDKANWLTKNNNVEGSKQEPLSAEDVNNAIFIKLASGVMHVSQDVGTHHPCLRHRLESVSNRIPSWPDMTNCCPRGIWNPCWC